MSFILKKLVFVPTTTTTTTTSTTTTTTTLPPVFAEITIGFDVTGENSTISFLLDSTLVEFTGLTEVLNPQEYSGGTDGALTAGSFKDSVDNYLTTNGIASLYSTSIFNTTGVTITATNSGVAYNFGTVTINNTKAVISSEGIPSAGSVSVLDNRTFYEPLPDNDRVNYINPPQDNSTIVIDLGAGGAADGIDLVVNGYVSATTSMYQTNLDAASSNYGYPNNGDFRYGSVSGATGTPPSPTFTYNNIVRYNTSDKYIGTLNPINGGVIPNRVDDFETETGVNLEFKDVQLAGGGYIPAQQRTWLTGLNQSDNIEIHVTGAIADAAIPPINAYGVRPSHYYPAGVLSNVVVIQHPTYTYSHAGGSTGWGINVYFVSGEDGNTILVNQVSA